MSDIMIGVLGILGLLLLIASNMHIGIALILVSISAIFEIARETNDYASESFMQWFVDEQVEEESTMDALLQVAERVREYPMMLEEFLARDGGDLASA